jgi:deoxycytidine triphosphate deaminase/intein/homing endonuclease
MSIKSDRWIRRMAESQGMIDPFSPEQVRVAGGHKIVSYGTSSYGYDVRCADEFKIFTNINSTIVDPKNFDEKSFVDFKGPVCIIPPNSFALASTVEFFRIPRSVLTVCLGKCLPGDTRVVDADTGAYVPITEMRWGKSTLALDSWRLKRAKVSAFIPQGRKEVFELRTRAGLRIRATANHPFRQLNGWVALSDLRPGDRIAAARDIPIFGKASIPDWEASLLGLMISAGQCDTPGHSPTYTTADPALVQVLTACVADAGMGVVTHNGRYGYRLVNKRGRGGAPERSRAHLWLQKYGLNVGAGEKFVPQSVFTAPENSVRLFLQSLFSGDGGIYHSENGVFLEYYSKSRRLIEDVHHLLLRFGIFSLIREKTTSIGTLACKIQVTDKDQIRRFAERIGFTPGSVKQQRLDTEILPMIRAQPRRRSNFDTLPQEAWQMLGMAARVGGLPLNSLNIHAQSAQSAPYSAAIQVARATGDMYVRPLIDGPVWDVVESIEPAGMEEVFDISVPTLHNFVANDLIVHNSTYARCFRGDTRVALVDGNAPTLEEMARGQAAGEIYLGYSIGPNGQLIVSQLLAPRFIGRDALLEIELDNGARVHATPDHMFMRRDGRMTQAHTLRVGEALMPLYRDLVRGYETVYQPIDGRVIETRVLAHEWNVRHNILDARDMHRRHLHFGSRGNRTANVSAEYLNHKIVAIREIAGQHDVYCLTVPEAGNFALQAGVFVHNCGIIVNVTPLEPEWEGHVTLEFSNTTPLPAKIYANEGVAQMLFFEADEVCETSYRDRGGKYQGQRGVTLPKT